MAYTNGATRQFKGGSFVLKYLQKEIGIANLVALEVIDDFNDEKRIYDIVANVKINGEMVSVNFELKAWGNMWNNPYDWKNAIRKQLPKDLRKPNLFRWVFEESNLIGSKADFKQKIMDALYPFDASKQKKVACTELEFDTYKAQYAALVKVLDDSDFTIEKFMEKLLSDKYFDQIFFRSKITN